VLHSPAPCLHCLLPPIESNPHCLCSRDHNFQLPVCNLNSRRTSFIIRGLYQLWVGFDCLFVLFHDCQLVFVNIQCSVVYFTFCTISILTALNSVACTSVTCFSTVLITFTPCAVDIVKCPWSSFFYLRHFIIDCFTLHYITLHFNKYSILNPNTKPRRDLLKVFQSCAERDVCYFEVNAVFNMWTLARWCCLKRWWESSMSEVYLVYILNDVHYGAAAMQPCSVVVVRATVCSTRGWETPARWYYWK